MRGTRRRPVVSALIAVIGGGAVIAATFLVWLDADGGVSVGSASVTGRPKGNELLIGQIALGAGVAVVVLGFLLLLLGRVRRLVGLLVFLGGIVSIGTAAYVASAPQDRYIDFATDAGAPSGHEDDTRASLTNLFRVSGLTVDPGIGSYVAIGGGAIAALGGLGALLGRRRSKADAEASTASPSDLEEITETPIAKSALFGVIGGAAVIGGTFLAWVDVGRGVAVSNVIVTGTPKGSELPLGQVALGAGIAVVVFGLLLLLPGRARRLFGLLVLLGGIVAIGTAAYVASAPQDPYIDFATKAAPPGQEDFTRTSLTELFRVSGLTADPGIGSFVAIGGGAVAALGGLRALVGRRKSKAEAEAPTAPSTDLEESTEAPVDQGPVPPIRESPRPGVDVVERPPATPEEPEPAPVEETPPEEPPQKKPPAEELHNRDEWSF